MLDRKRYGVRQSRPNLDKTLKLLDQVQTKISGTIQTVVWGAQQALFIDHKSLQLIHVKECG